jgi:hypothetical protein
MKNRRIKDEARHEGSVGEHLVIVLNSYVDVYGRMKDKGLGRKDEG